MRATGRPHSSHRRDDAAGRDASDPASRPWGESELPRRENEIAHSDDASNRVPQRQASRGRGDGSRQDPALHAIHRVPTGSTVRAGQAAVWR